VPGEALGEKADTIHCDVGCGLASDSARNLAFKKARTIDGMDRYGAAENKHPALETGTMEPYPIQFPSPSIQSRPQASRFVVVI
jgi:hypothetical protein